MSKKLFMRNLGQNDRIIRFIIGVVALGAWYFGVVAGTIAVISGVVAIMLIGTSAAASCPLNSVANINTMSQKEREEHDAKGISYQKK
ncbi:MAG: DUF2892 domain-containing protein [Chryseotalea sp.]|jgi:hypothetical protein|nr:DUF2892 domain-containing protein [Cytophagales bacterium]